MCQSISPQFTVFATCLYIINSCFAATCSPFVYIHLNILLSVLPFSTYNPFQFYNFTSPWRNTLFFIHTITKLCVKQPVATYWNIIISLLSGGGGGSDDGVGEYAFSRLFLELSYLISWSCLNVECYCFVFSWLSLLIGVVWVSDKNAKLECKSLRGSGFLVQDILPLIYFFLYYIHIYIQRLQILFCYPTIIINLKWQEKFFTIANIPSW